MNFAAELLLKKRYAQLLWSYIHASLWSEADW